MCDKKYHVHDKICALQKQTRNLTKAKIGRGKDLFIYCHFIRIYHANLLAESVVRTPSLIYLFGVNIAFWVLRLVLLRFGDQHLLTGEVNIMRNHAFL